MSRDSETLTSADSGPCLLDTSAAIAFVVVDHEHHSRAFEALRDRERGLAGHAAFETFSVLTRLPTPARLTPTTASRILATNFPHTRFLSARRASALLRSLAEQGLAGGDVYDALVGATALEHERTLVTRDLRALGTYRRLGVSVEVLT